MEKTKKISAKLTIYGFIIFFLEIFGIPFLLYLGWTSFIIPYFGIANPGYLPLFMFYFAFKLVFGKKNKSDLKNLDYDKFLKSREVKDIKLSHFTLKGMPSEYENEPKEKLEEYAEYLSEKMVKILSDRIKDMCYALVIILIHMFFVL